MGLPRRAHVMITPEKVHCQTNSAQQDVLAQPLRSTVRCVFSVSRGQGGAVSPPPQGKFRSKIGPVKHPSASTSGKRLHKQEVAVLLRCARCIGGASPHCVTTAHPDFDQGPTDLRSAAVATELRTLVPMDLSRRPHVMITRGEAHCQTDDARQDMLLRNRCA